MQEYELDILEQYELDVKGTRKTRGAFFCDTDQGLYIVKEARCSDKRAAQIDLILEHLEESGYGWTDRLLPNKEGKLVSVSEEGGRYLVKRWFFGKECEVRRNRELLEATGNLARLHQMLRIPLEEQEAPADLQKLYAARNRELRKVRKFVRGRTTKGEFELQFLKEFDAWYIWAEAALSELESSNYETLFQESIQSNTLIHGEYNYHNILFTQNGIATTNFEKCRPNVQMEDLYYFIRKAMEKHSWNVRLCDCMLSAYHAICPIEEKEMEYLKLRFIYPEKFWKIAGSYYHSNKAWISVKNVEKFQIAILQEEEKKKLLKDIFAYEGV